MDSLDPKRDSLKGMLPMLKAKIKDQNYYLANVYGPNKDAEAVHFYQDLSAKLREMEPTSQGSYSYWD